MNYVDLLFSEDEDKSFVPESLVEDELLKLLKFCGVFHSIEEYEAACMADALVDANNLKDYEWKVRSDRPPFGIRNHFGLLPEEQRPIPDAVFHADGEHERLTRIAHNNLAPAPDSRKRKGIHFRYNIPKRASNGDGFDGGKDWRFVIASPRWYKNEGMPSIYIFSHDCEHAPGRAVHFIHRYRSHPTRKQRKPKQKPFSNFTNESAPTKSGASERKRKCG